jgi:hypothetical protein
VKRLLAALLASACLILVPVSSAATKPDISGTTLTGKRLLSWYRGRWVFLNVRASW